MVPWPGINGNTTSAAITRIVPGTPTRTVFRRYARSSSSTGTGPGAADGRDADGSTIAGHQHDLAELAAGGEPLVGRDDVGQRERRRHWHPHPPVGEERQELGLDPPRRDRLLLERPGPKGRAVDPGPTG